MQKVKKPVLVEKVFPARKISLFAKKTISLGQGSDKITTTVKRVDPVAIVELRKIANDYTKAIVSKAVIVMKTYNRAFSPSIIKYIIEHIGMKIHGLGEGGEEAVVFPHTLFHRYVKQLFAKAGQDNKRIGTAGSKALQYVVEMKLTLLINTALLFVLVSKKSTLKMIHVIAAEKAKATCASTLIATSASKRKSKSKSSSKHKSKSKSPSKRKSKSKSPSKRKSKSKSPSKRKSKSKSPSKHKSKSLKKKSACPPVLSKKIKIHHKKHNRYGSTSTMYKRMKKY